MTKYIGAHVSASGGLGNAILNAEAIGANAFALFTRNQRSWTSKPLTTDEIHTFQQLLIERGFQPQHVLPHDSYLINLGNPAAPVLTTAATRPGLTYTLREGATLKTMGSGATKQGDGKPWTPTITVKGGESGFYTITVEK